MTNKDSKLSQTLLTKQENDKYFEKSWKLQKKF